jgi:TonB-dependent starch-binding outer membrane protein SusC
MIAMNQNAKRFSYLFKFLILLSVASLHYVCSYAQQTITITGKVTESGKNIGLSGASIVVKGTNKGAISDENGNFSVTVPAGSHLIFTYLKYELQEKVVTKSEILNITLNALPNSLNDVIVIGYGERRRRDVTGAVSQIGVADIEKSTAMTPEVALQGTVAGVLVQGGGGDPSARPVIRIRGVNTFGYSDPLFVVDGVPIYEGGASNLDGGIQDIRGNINIYSLINPDDIETMTVLKDASSAAIYGVRASNGVILITTKKGKTGKPKVEFSGYYGIQNIGKKMSLLNTKQYFQVFTEAYNNNPDRDGNGNILPIGAADPNAPQNSIGPQYSPDSAQYGGNNPTTNWVGAITNKNAPLQNYSVRVSGASDNTNYYVSLGYAKTESPLNANNLSRYSLATNVESKISKYLSVGMTVRLTSEQGLTNTQASLGEMVNSIPFQPIYNASGPYGLQPVVTGIFTPNSSYDPTLLSPGAFQNFSFTYNYGKNTRYNPIGFEQLNSTTYQLYNALGNAFVQITPIPGLNIKGVLGGQFLNNTRDTWGSFDAWQFSQTPQNPFASQDGTAKGQLNVRQGITTNLNKEVTINYNHSFGMHNIDVLLGGSEQFAQWKWNDITGNVAYASPQYRSITNQPPYTAGASGIIEEDNLIGYFARVSYKYNEKYYLDGTLRYDGSSRLAPGHKFDYFPSFAAAWRISQEKFFPKTNYINDLKLRGGYGILGNYQSAMPYAYLSGVSNAPHTSTGSGNGSASGQYALGVFLPNFANTDLTWEKVKSTDVGFDAVLFDHFTLGFDYYYKLTYGIIQAVSLPPNTGIEAPADLNIANVENYGVEFTLGYNNKIGDVDVNFSGNFSTINNKVLKLNEGNAFGGAAPNTRIEEGYSMNYLYGYKVGGIFQNQQQINTWRQSHADLTIGQSLSDPTTGYTYQPGDMYFQDINSNPPAGSKQASVPGPDSLINSSDQTYLGKTIPSYTYGFSMGANWKSFDLSVLFQGVGNVQGYNSLRAGLDNPGSLGNMSTDVLSRWTPTNPSKTIPRAVYNDPANTLRFSSRFIEQAGYFRLKNITLGYSIPKSVLGKAGFIQNFRIYVTSINLFTITKWTGYDPESDLISNLNNNVSAAGSPNTIQFLVGIKATF